MTKKKGIDQDALVALLQHNDIAPPPGGFLFGLGWVRLVRELIIDLCTAGWDRDLHQVKEKFGGLRFYIGDGSAEVFRLIHNAETASFTICENCGSAGSLRQMRTGWMKTACDQCANE